MKPLEKHLCLVSTDGHDWDLADRNLSDFERRNIAIAIRIDVKNGEIRVLKSSGDTFVVGRYVSEMSS